jgi:hypothetical protein
LAFHDVILDFGIGRREAASSIAHNLLPTERDVGKLIS